MSRRTKPGEVFLAEGCPTAEEVRRAREQDDIDARRAEPRVQIRPTGE